MFTCRFTEIAALVLFSARCGADGARGGGELLPRNHFDHAAEFTAAVGDQAIPFTDQPIDLLENGRAVPAAIDAAEKARPGIGLAVACGHHRPDILHPRGLR